MSSTLNNSPTVVVVTGASGLIGAAISLLFLERGHTVRLPLRKQVQVDAWLKEYGTKFGDKLQPSVLKQSIAEEGAFDEAVKGAEIVVHAASPASFAIEGGAEAGYLKPAIDGTLSILKSAKKSGTVKSFVYTTSGAAFATIKDLLSLPDDYVVREDTWNPTTYEEAASLPVEAAGEIYAASKALAERAAFDFAAQPDVDFSFSSIAIFASAMGRHLAPGIKSFKDTHSSFELSLAVLWDQPAFPPYDGTGFNLELYVSVADIARAHVDAALNPSISSNKRYILVGDRKTWTQVARSMVKAEPSLKAHLPPFSETATEEEEPRRRFKYTADVVEKDFGWKYQPFDEYIGDFAHQVAQLAKNDGKL